MQINAALSPRQAGGMNGRASVSKPPTPNRPLESPTEGPIKDIRARLSNLATTFTGLEQQLQQNKMKKKDDYEKAIQEIKAQISQSCNEILLESQKREETVTTLEQTYEQKITRTRQSIEKPLYEKIDNIVESIQYLSHKIDKIGEKIEQDRENFPKMIDLKALELTKQIQDFQTKFENDLNDREDKQQLIEKCLEEQEFRVKQLVEAEQVDREKKVMRIQQEIQQETEMRMKSHKAVDDFLRNHVQRLQVRIDKDARLRDESTDQLVKALCQYTAALHDGVKIVSEGS